MLTILDQGPALLPWCRPEHVKPSQPELRNVTVENAFGLYLHPSGSPRMAVGLDKRAAIDHPKAVGSEQTTTDQASEPGACCGLLSGWHP